MDTLTELMDLLGPWMALLFLAGALLLIAGGLSRWMHLADSPSSRRLEKTLLGLGSRLAIGVVGLVWIVLWAVEYFYTDLMAHLPK